MEKLDRESEEFLSFLFTDKKLWQALYKIYITFVNNDYEIFLIGGCVRDILLKRKPKDWDFVTDATPDQIKKLFPKVKLIGEHFGVAEIVINDIHFEIATYRSDQAYTNHRCPDSVIFASSLEEDVARRDFTINALALDIDFNLYDYHGGLKDLRNKVIRTINNPKDRFHEDALRILRAIRLACQLGFNIDSQTLSSINLLFEDVNKYVSKDRIHKEFIKIFNRNSLEKNSLDLIQETEIIENIFRESAIINHRLLTYDNLKEFSYFDYLVHSLYILFQNENGIDFEKLKDKLIEYKFSNEEISNIIEIIKGTQNLYKINNKISLKKIQLNKYFEDILNFYKLIQKVYGDKNEFVDNQLEKLHHLDIKPIITGKDLLSLGFEQGKNLGLVLKFIFDWQLSDESLTRKDLLEKAKQFKLTFN